MAYIVADNILSPLGFGTEGNISAVLNGQSALCQHLAKECRVGEGYTASVFSEEQRADLLNLAPEDGLTLFERKAVASARKALAQLPKDSLLSGRTVFILSTTKGNIESLAYADKEEEAAVAPGLTAEKIAKVIGIEANALAVCNACISGLSALILGQRLIQQGTYDQAIVCGADDIGRFVVSGFQSLKALSPTPCRPFDMERMGLNLGEAAVTVVLSRCPLSDGRAWRLDNGVVRNDAYDIVAPSKKAEGQTRCLQYLLEENGTDAIFFVNLHGTATLFNDQMESIALQRAGLSATPANALKGYYGHTLGAAGLLETVVSIHCAEKGLLPATKGFAELGVSGKADISADTRRIEDGRFIKTLSGFGGCNAAALFSQTAVEGRIQSSHKTTRTLTTLHRVQLTPDTILVDGKEISHEASGDKMLTALYKQRVADYPKYYKMDGLCRLGFIATELLLQAESECDGAARFCERDDRAVVLFGKNSSIQADRKFLNTIERSEDYFPSPAVFVYTLPNIVTGELAIRNKLHGETTYYALPCHDIALMQEILEATAADKSLCSLIAGWLDYVDGEHFLADLHLYEIK